MALTEESVIDQIEVLENNTIQVRTANIVKRDGTEISRTFHRHVIVPGEDYSGEDAKVKSIAEVLHTAEVIAAYEASIS
tara:strand:+ start:1212 stop:1448 length:237 start_codon:yes stop_codon:yes gene_type:complete